MLLHLLQSTLPKDSKHYALDVIVNLEIVDEIRMTETTTENDEILFSIRLDYRGASLYENHSSENVMKNSLKSILYKMGNSHSDIEFIIDNFNIFQINKKDDVKKKEEKIRKMLEDL